MAKAYRVVKLVTAVLTVLLTAMLIFEAADIYLGAEPGVQMYRREDIGARILTVLPVFVLWAVSAAVGTVLRVKTGEREKKRVEKPAERRTDSRAVLAARIALLAAGILFIGLGAANGGLWDVLVKAINICTECIGLG